MIFTFLCLSPFLFLFNSSNSHSLRSNHDMFFHLLKSHDIPFILSSPFLSFILSSFGHFSQDGEISPLHHQYLSLRRLRIPLPYNYLLLPPSTCLKGLPQDSNVINLLQRLCWTSSCLQHPNHHLLSCTWHFSPYFYYLLPSFFKPTITQTQDKRKAKTTVVLMIQEMWYYCYKRTTRLIIVIPVPVPDIVLALAIGYSFVKSISPFFHQPLDKLMSLTIALRHLPLCNQPLLEGRDCHAYG